MATIGSLQVNVVANTAHFIKGLQKTQAVAGGFVKKLNTMGKAISGMATSANAVQGLIAAGVGLVANAAIQAGSKIFELTRKLHVSAEAITALHYAAEQLESSADAVDVGMAKMAITLGKALGGSREAANAFGEIGIAIQDLSKLSPDQQFLKTIDALHGIADKSRQAALAQAIFGKRAGELIPLIEAGSAAIQEQAQKAADLGAVMGGKTAEGLNAAGDSMKSLTATWVGFRNEAVATFAPVLEFVSWLGTKAINVVNAFGSMIQTAIVGACELASKALLGLVEAVNGLLPKSMEFDTEKIKSYVDSFQDMRKDRAAAFENNSAKALGMGGNTPNPLQPAVGSLGAPATQNVAIANDTLQLMLVEMRRLNERQPQPTLNAPPPTVTAGVR